MSDLSIGHPLVGDPDYASLKQFVIDATGLAYYANKDNDLAIRLSNRLSQLTLKGCGAYLELLKNRQAGDSERHLLIAQLTIGETYFFRHIEQLDALCEIVFPGAIQRNQATRTLRIWCAGCAIGAEPYSVAMLLKRHFGDQLAGWNVQILGTDINQTFLARATRGEFDDRALRSTSEEVKRQWFSRSKDSWTVDAALKEWVSFQYHNLVEHPFPSIVHGLAAFDVILCRNVMIYFDWDLIQRILGQFHECLVDGGWLAVGHAESNTEVFRAYRTVNVPGATLYQKSSVPSTENERATARPVDAPWSPPIAGLQQPWSPPTLPDAPPLAPARLAPEPARQASSGLALVRRLADEGKWTEAATECDRLLLGDKLNPKLHFYQALVAEQTGRQSDAEQALRRALYLDRAFVFAHYHLALLLSKSGRRDNAIQSFRNVHVLVSGMDRNQEIADAEGITADDLAQLATMHLDLLQP